MAKYEKSVGNGKCFKMLKTFACRRSFSSTCALFSVKTTAQTLQKASDAIKVMNWKKPRALQDNKKLFIDYRKIKVQGGNGGDGSISFLRLWCNEWAGPDGGDGGCGGHVVLEVDVNCKSLCHVKTVNIADSGKNGGTKNCAGENARHLVIKVPPGTMIFDDNSHIIGDLQKTGDMYIAARGGAGGKGNYFFACNENRAPYLAEEGAQGESKQVQLELRTIAHAGLVGFPNAGKSTLLRAISRARPKVAAYPFTTRNPFIGIVQYEDYEQISVADIPGLIKDAHLNRGLGYSFLKHVERCECLLFVIDLSLDDPLSQFEDLKHELEQYKQGLSTVPHAIVANKADLSMSQRNLNAFQHIDKPVIPVSAKYKKNIEPILTFLRKTYDEARGREREVENAAL